MLLGMVEETELAFFLRTGDIGQNPGGSLCTGVEEGTGQDREEPPRPGRRGETLQERGLGLELLAPHGTCFRKSGGRKAGTGIVVIRVEI